MKMAERMGFSFGENVFFFFFFEKSFGENVKS